MNAPQLTHRHVVLPHSAIASLEDPRTAAAPDPLHADRLVIGSLVQVENDAPKLIAELERLLPTLRDDAYYWQVLLAMWVKNGRSEYAARYRALFEAPRRNRARGMKKADRRAWRALPDSVRAYRAIAPDEPSTVFAWSLDSARLRALYPDREIIEALVPKAAIAFYVDRREEREVIIL